MTRSLTATATAAALALPLLIAAPAAHADETLVFTPPFSPEAAIGSATYRRCPGDGGPVWVPRPARDGTRIDYGEGVAAERCTRNASYADFWIAGAIPDEWQGRRARIQIDILLDRAVIRDGGKSGPRGARMTLTAPGRTWTLLETRCRGTSCARGGIFNGRRGEVVRLWSETGLGEDLRFHLAASAAIRGTGIALVAMWARIDRITVTEA